MSTKNCSPTQIISFFVIISYYLLICSTRLQKANKAPRKLFVFVTYYTYTVNHLYDFEGTEILIKSTTAEISKD